MPNRRNIPKPAARRLSLYLRELASRLEAGEETVSSKALGRSLGLTDAQVRKDLALFGQFGHPGRGYAVNDLVVSLRRIMGRDREWRACLVGAGNIGRALISYDRFRREGFRIAAVFDADPAAAGKDVGGGLKIRKMSDLLGRWGEGHPELRAPPDRGPRGHRHHERRLHRRARADRLPDRLRNGC